MERIAEADRPVGPPMKPREGIEFLVMLAGLEPEKLGTAGRPANVADLGHVTGVFYELCRFTQGARRYYEKWVGPLAKEPWRLQPAIDEMRRLLGALADGQDYDMGLDPDTRIRIFGVQFHRTPFRSPLPFVISNPTIIQGLVVTAIFYLALNRDSCLIRRCREEKCRKLFLAVRKSRVFCSHQCASDASVRRFRRRQKQRSAG